MNSLNRKRGDIMRTAKGYKLFRVLKTQPGKIFPLYVNASESIPIGKWIKAGYGEINEDGKVKSKLGPLRFRPGFHINDQVPYVSHIGRKVNGKICYMRPDTVWAEVEYCIDRDYSDEAKRNGIINGRFNHMKADLDYIPVNGFYRYKTNPSMTGEWIIAGEMKVLRILNDNEVKMLCVQHNSPYLPREKVIDLEEYGLAI